MSEKCCVTCRAFANGCGELYAKEDHSCWMPYEEPIRKDVKEFVDKAFDSVDLNLKCKKGTADCCCDRCLTKKRIGIIKEIMRIRLEYLSIELARLKG